MANASADVVRSWLVALFAGDDDAVRAGLHTECFVLLHGAEADEAQRPRERAMARLCAERATWVKDSGELLAAVAEGDRVAVQLRAALMVGARRAERNYAGFFEVRDDAIERIELYSAGLAPAARRHGWIAPCDLSDADLDATLATYGDLADVRLGGPPSIDYHATLELVRKGSAGLHPSLNRVRGTFFAAADADRRIEETIEHHRAQGVGFVWQTSPLDQPADLADRLERAGLACAGHQSVMARRGLAPTDLRVGSDIQVEPFDWDDRATTEAVVDVIADAFHWTPEQTARLGEFFARRADAAAFRARAIEFVARVDGAIVGYAGLQLRGGFAQLEGAATRPSHQGRGVYQSLLHHRLAAAHARGYHIAAIAAFPMSRRVVARFGFEERFREAWYAWMPEMDPDVIAQLIPNE